MRVRIPVVLQRYTQVLWIGGLLLTATTLLADRRWMAQPISTLVLIVAILALRSVPVAAVCLPGR